MADQGQAESTGTKIRKSRDGEPLDPTTATQNPLKKKLDALGGSWEAIQAISEAQGNKLVQR